MVYIFAVHMIPGGSGHEHIAKVKWKNPDNGKQGESTCSVMVNYITNQNGAVYVCGGHAHIARVGVVSGNPPYLRTYADGAWSDNLLALPKY